MEVFDAEDFDVQVAVEQLGGLSVADAINRDLNNRLHFVDSEIRQHVTEHYEDLISHSTGIKRVENVLNMMQNKSHSLSLSINRVKSKVDDSYNKSQSKVVQLENMQNVCDSLRKVIRVLFIGRRLQQQLDTGDRDLAKAAQSVWQLDQLFSSSEDLSRIEVCMPMERLLKEAAQKIKVRLVELLHKSLNEENHNTLGSVLQAYYHLNQLTSCLGTVVEELKKNLSTEVSKLLSINQLNKSESNKGFGPGKANMPITGNSAIIRSNFWTNTEKIVSLCVASIQKYHFVMTLLSKKKDSATNYCSFLELVAAENEDLVSLESYFRFVQNLLKTEFSKCASNSSTLKQIIESEYPKFLKSFLNLRDKTASYCELNSDSMGISDYSRGSANTIQNGWKKCLDDFLSAYLSRSLSRLFDPVNLAFSKKDVKLPNSDETNAILGGITSELNVVQFDTDLTAAVCKNVAKMLNLFAIKAEEIVPASSPDCWQLLTSMNDTQQFMVSVANSVYAFRANAIEVLEKVSLSPNCKIILNPSIEKLESTVLNILHTWLSHAQNYVKDIIKTLHKEKFVLESTAIATDKTSLYIRELSAFTQRVYQSYLSKFTCYNCVENACDEIFKNCSEFLMLHVAMICEVNEPGFSVISKDIEQFEISMKQLYPSSNYSFKSLRLFSTIVNYEPEALVELLKTSDLIKPSIVLMVLFSRAYPEITPPHVAADMDNLDMSKWFDDHPMEKDRIAFFNSGLEAYVQKVRNEGVKEYSKFYRHLRSMLQLAFDKVSPAASQTTSL
ncbi:conserved oligomeric Golgi complex subunit 5-like [Convolutriloba macropyga]|uniref:conserved oligomeric Golgi complex subunit 5-like n=1 Tax=Convolutriloba macropyga TaxID=536237 RepID=UPI003F5261F7